MLQALRSKLDNGEVPSAHALARLETESKRPSASLTALSGPWQQGTGADSSHLWPHTPLQALQAATNAGPPITSLTAAQHQAPASAGSWHDLRAALSSDRCTQAAHTYQAASRPKLWSAEHDFQEDLSIAMAALTTVSTQSSCSASLPQDLVYLPLQAPPDTDLHSFLYMRPQAPEFTSSAIPPKWSSPLEVCRAAGEFVQADGRQCSPHCGPDHSQPGSARPGSADSGNSPLPSLRHWDEEPDSPLQLHLPPSPPSAGRAPTSLCKPALSAPSAYDQIDSPTTPRSSHPAASQQSFWPAAPKASASSPAPPTPLQQAPNPPRGIVHSPRSTSPWYQQRLHSMQAARLQPSFPQASAQQPSQQLQTPFQAAALLQQPADSPCAPAAGPPAPETALDSLEHRPRRRLAYGRPDSGPAVPQPGYYESASLLQPYRPAAAQPPSAEADPRPVPGEYPDSRHQDLPASHRQRPVRQAPAGPQPSSPAPQQALQQVWPPAEYSGLQSGPELDPARPHEPQTGSPEPLSAQLRQHTSWLRRQHGPGGQGIMHTHSALEHLREPAPQQRHGPSIMQSHSSLEAMRRAEAAPHSRGMERHAVSLHSHRVQPKGRSAGPSDSAASLGHSLRQSLDPQPAARDNHVSPAEHVAAAPADLQQPALQAQLPQGKAGPQTYQLRYRLQDKHRLGGSRSDPRLVQGSAAASLASQRRAWQAGAEPPQLPPKQQQQQHSRVSAFYDAREPQPEAAHSPGLQPGSSAASCDFSSLNSSRSAAKPGIRTCQIWQADGRAYTGQGDGLGVCTWHNGNQYQGSFQDCQVHGLGVFQFRAGGEYAGQWRSGKFSGLGMERFADGTLFVGEYEDGLADGSGVAIYLDGSMHEGHFAAGKPHGRGLHKGGDGSLSVGMYVDGFREGLAAHDLPNGDRYVGAWLADKPEGHGCLSCVDGTLYKGSFRSGLRHGWGVLASPAGRIICGFWQSGRKLWAQAHPNQDHPASRRHVQHPFGAEEAESCDLAIQAAELACSAGDKAMDLVFAHPKEVRKLAKHAAIEAREAALAAEEVQAMAAQLADRHGPSDGPAPSLTGHDRVGDIHALVKRLCSASTLLPA